MMASPARRRLLAGTALVTLVTLTGCGPVDHSAGGAAADSPTASSPTSFTASSANPSGRPSGGSSGRSGATGTPDHGGTRPARPRTGTDECRSADLRVSRADSEMGGMGHAIVRLVFRNASSHACWMRGYPGVSYVSGDDGHQVGAAARRDRDRPPPAARIWLIPNAHAHAFLDQVNPHNYPSARCHPTTVRGIRVYPPDETSALYIPGKTQTCAKPGTGRPTITAITKAGH